MSSDEKLFDDYFKTQCGIPKRYRVLKWGDYKAKDVRAKEKAYKYAEEYSNSVPHGIYFYGNPGSGKTFLCTQVLMDIARRNALRVPVRFIDFTELCLVFTDGYQDSETRAVLLKELRKVSLLALDNFPGTASEQIIKKVMAAVYTPRFQNNRATLITSTLSPGAIKEISPQLASELKEGCVALLVDNTDFRDTIKPKIS